MRTRRLLAIGLLFAALGWAPRAEAALCLYDALSSGKTMTWAKMPISYLINASKVAAAQKTPFIDAVKAAFTAYTQITCADIQFKYDGESTSVDPSSLNAILVDFSDVGGTGAYYYKAESVPPNPEIIVAALIQMNIKSFNYTVGAEANKIDVQTAVMQMLPGALGYYVGADPATGNLAEIKYNTVNHTISEDQIKGAEFLYFKAGGTCAKPTQPTFCTKTTPPGDGTTVVGDGGPKPTTDGGTPPVGDGGITPTGDGAPIGGEPGTLPPPEDDDGCCRVSHARHQGARGFLALAGLGLLLALRRRRR